mmetsp:Transcript_11718/g.34654  ORF Transcript_11718/g.34654 Transcript_11718/m.34654 type:complete len:295 (-) Transcript_11718:36-920(-)
MRLLQVRNHVQLKGRVSLRRVQHHAIHTRLHEGLDALLVGVARADGRTRQEAAAGVHGRRTGRGVLHGLLEVLARRKRNQLAAGVDEADVVEAVLLQPRQHLRRGGRGRHRHRVRVHDLAERLHAVRHEVDVARRHHTEQLAAHRPRVRHAHCAEVGKRVRLVDLAHRVARLEHHGRHHHARQVLLDLAHMRALRLHSVVVVHKAHAAKHGHGHSHVALRDSVHGGADNGSAQLDVLGDVRCQVHLMCAEVDVARVEDAVVVGVADALREHHLGGEPIVDVGHLVVFCLRGVCA